MFRMEHCPAGARKAEALVNDSRLPVSSNATGETQVKRGGRHWGRKFQEQGVSASPCSWKRNQPEEFDVGCRGGANRGQVLWCSRATRSSQRKVGEGSGCEGVDWNLKLPQNLAEGSRRKVIDEPSL